MGRKIITNNINEWKIFSTMSDSIVAEFETEKDLKKFLALEEIYNGKLKAIEVLMSFPFQYSVNDTTLCRDNKEGKEKYYEWLKEEVYETDTYEEYYSVIDKKLNELMNREGM
jgi:hypothetical protein